MAPHVDETTLNNTEIYTTPRDAAVLTPTPGILVRMG